jgi:hypothetical protein
MRNISSTAELLDTIQILEAEQAGHLYHMREKFYITRESLRPVNLIGNSLKGMVMSPNLVNNILGIAVGLFTGYLSRKAMFAGVATNKYRRILGKVLQYGITGIVARSPQVIKSFKNFIFQRLSRNKNKDLQDSDGRN